MKKESILFTITITFVVSLILILISFIVLYEGSKKREERFVLERNMDIARMFNREYRFNGLTKELRENLKSMNFSIITDGDEINGILYDKNILEINVRKRGKQPFRHFKLDNNYLIHINTRRANAILFNNNQVTNPQNTILVIFSVLFLAFIFLYVTTLRKLKPLKILTKKVENFGDEEFDIECSTTAQDEISLLANEFDKSAKKLKKLKESRNIFIRNIMHELKTPITKGKFLTELPSTKENSEKMKKVFYRLESLINEFASIEELLSSKKELEKQDYSLEDIVDNAVDILMCDENQISKEFDDMRLNVNFKLFSIAIKNLLDNGIKYSSDKKVKIKAQDGELLFENSGERLKYPLSSYYEPFFKGDEVESNQSFGLGLYIVKHILEANNCSLEYIYENETNKFIVYFQ